MGALLTVILLGLLVTEVEPGSSAEAIGLRPRDVIVSCDGSRVVNLLQLEIEIERTIENAPEELAILLIVRGEEPIEVRVASMPECLTVEAVTIDSDDPRIRALVRRNARALVT